jgi:HAD superfamily hydrolase (TIGR01549 family)
MPILADLAVDVICSRYDLARDVVRCAYLATSGLPFDEQLAFIFPPHVEDKTVASEFERRKAAAVTKVTYDAVTVEVLRALRSAGYRLVISSNTSQALVDHFASRSGIAFDMALGRGDGLRKGRSHVRKVMSQLTCGPQDLLFVGDSLRDAQLAHEAGIAFIAKLGTFTREQFAASNPAVDCVRDLRELAGRLVSAASGRSER